MMMMTIIIINNSDDDIEMYHARTHSTGLLRK